MKNNAKTIIYLAGIGLLIAGGIKFCNKNHNKIQERRETRREIKKFGNFILENANAEVMDKMSKNPQVNEYEGYGRDKLQAWIDLYSNDSAVYANALKRDAWIIYKPVADKKELLKQIKNAPVYSRGPGTEFDQDGNATYNPNSIKGVSKYHTMEVNYNNYKDRIRELYLMRSAMAQHHKHK